MKDLVTRTILGRTLGQLEFGRIHNNVHYVLNKEHASDPFLTSLDVRRILSNTPKFIPTPKRKSPKDLERDCDLFGFRLIKTFNRYVYRNYIQNAKLTSEAAGIISWIPEKIPHSADYYNQYVRDFFDVHRPSGTVWRANFDQCPDLQQLITGFKRDTLKCFEKISQRGIRVKPNISLRNRNIIRELANKQVGYNISDKNMGPTLYSLDLFHKQCRLHLYDDKGTYEPIQESPTQILQKVVRKLKQLLTTYCNDCEATQILARTLVTYAEESLSHGNLCKFYII